MKITVLAFFDRISAFHSLKPFLFSKHRKMFNYTRDPEHLLKGDKNKVLFMDRWFLKPDRVDIEFLKRLRDKYETIFFFNGNAGGGIPRLEVLPYVDYLFNKALFKDRSLYERRLYGDELFTDYYHTTYGVEDPEPRRRLTLREVVGDEATAIEAALAKLKVGWNIGIGDFPKLKTRQRIAVGLSRIFGMQVVRPFYKNPELPTELPENRELYDVQARWGGPKRPTLKIHRELMEERIKEDPRFLVGRVEQNRYNEEIRHSKITLSPFGWGELCFRDFEAVLNGSLLLKPDMSHLETWPDIFLPYETYVPTEWDGEDVVEKGAHYLEDMEERHRIVRQAFDRFREEAGKLEERLEGILELLPR
ncbi:MAG: glycosyltransferase [Spirochaetaceae bacterium]